MKSFVVRCFGYSLALAFTFSGSLFAQSTQLLSVPDNGQVVSDSGSGDSLTPIISADGRYVLFASTANNLVAFPTNRPIPAVAPSPLNVYLRDRVSAATTLVSVNSSGAGGGNDNSWPIALSTNGQFVLFESAASNLISSDTNNATDIFVRDLVNGQTLLVSANTAGRVGNRSSSGSAMTPDGRYIAFLSSATDLVANDTNGIPDVSSGTCNPAIRFSSASALAQFQVQPSHHSFLPKSALMAGTSLSPVSERTSCQEFKQRTKFIFAIWCPERPSGPAAERRKPCVPSLIPPLQPRSITSLVLMDSLSVTRPARPP